MNQFSKPYIQACYCWKKLWKLRDTRDEAFHLLLSWPGCNSVVQEWIGELDRSRVARLSEMILEEQYSVCYVVYFMAVRAAMTKQTKRKVACRYNYNSSAAPLESALNYGKISYCQQ
jgi:hypothetical protein